MAKKKEWEFTKARQASLLKAQKVHVAYVEAGKRLLKRKKSKSSKG